MTEHSPPDDLYKLLFEHNPQPMWVYDVQTLRFLTVNNAAIAQYGYTRDEFLAMRITDIRPEEDVSTLLENVTLPSTPLRNSGVWRHRRKDGAILLVEISWHQIPYDDRHARLVLAQDVTERERASSELKRSRELYERQYEALAGLTRRNILQTVDEVAALREITRHTSHTLSVGRVSIWRMTPERDAIIARDLFDTATGQHTAGTRLDSSQYPDYFNALEAGDVIVADDVESDPRTAKLAEGHLRPIGITSMLDAPIMVDGRLDGVLCLAHTGEPRVWTPAERSFAVSAANLASLVIAQQSLSQSRSWLRTILDSEPECVSLVSPDGRLLEMNPAGLRMIEADSREAVLGIPAVTVVHPDHVREYNALLGAVMSGRSEHLQFRIIGLRGTERWIDTHAAPLHAADGTVLGMLAVTRDITARLQQERELQESRRRLDALMDHLPGMAYRCSGGSDRPMEFVSNGAVLLTGYPVRDLLQGGAHPYGTLIHADDRDSVWAQIQRAGAANEPFELEYRIACADGSTRWVWERGHAVRDTAQRAVVFEGFVTDTTQRKRSADELRIAEERFRMLASATSDAIWDWDIGTGHVWWSEGAEEMFGLQPGELSSIDSWTERIHPDDRARVMADVERALEPGGALYRSEFRFLHGEGSYITVLDRARVITDESGRALRMIGGMSDLTDVKRLEGQLLHSQKMESVGRLAGGIAHDFNNLLTVILGTVDLALTTMNPADPLIADLGEIRNAAQRAGGLTQQLLAFSRRQVLQPRVLDLNTAIGDTIAMLRRLIGEDVELRFNPGPDVWSVRADPGQLEQVLMNLAVNARDAMPDGGLLTISTRNVVIDEVFMASSAVARPGPHVAITVTDTGIGMDAVTRSHAFEPFFTTKKVGEGTGLGLPTVYGIVEQSGGSIDLYSEPGHGTTFRIFLPRAEAGGEARENEVAVQPGRGSGTIMLVEDESAVRRLTERVLKAAGYTVISCESGAEALSALDRSRTPIQLLLTDVVMPLMNGPELARRITAASPATRVLFMSGYTDDAMVKHGVHSGRTRFLEKPFTVGELTEAVHAALTEHAPA
ncbi:MAG TPA: PAS domain S-box protein [Longimicrobiales bacterium]